MFPAKFKLSGNRALVCQDVHDDIKADVFRHLKHVRVELPIALLPHTQWYEPACSVQGAKASS